MALPPPRPPGPGSFRHPRGVSVFAVSLRIAIGATIVGLILLAFRASGVGPRPSGADSESSGEAAASPEGVEVSVATATAAALPPPPRDQRLVPFHGLLESVSDFDDVAQNRAYAMLAEHVRSLTDDDAGRILRHDLDFKEISRAPQLVRGEYIRVDGLLIKLEAVRLVPGAGPPGVEDAWRGWIMEPGGEEAYVFDLVGEPVEVSRLDLVRVEGCFLKVIRYENKAGETRDAPFLLARRARRLTEGEIHRPFRYDYLAVALVAIAAILLLVKRKREKEERTLLEAKRAELERRFRKPKGDA